MRRRPLVAAVLLSLAVAAIAAFLLLRGGAPLSIEASYEGSELTLELADGASITIPVGAAQLGSRVRITAVDPADLPDLPEFSTGVWGAWDFDVEGGVLAPVTIRLPVSPADQSWVLARFKDGTWTPAGFELLGDRAVAVVDSAEQVALLKVICVAGTFPSFDPSCESFLLEGFAEAINALWRTFDPEPCPNPDSTIEVINDEGAELIHGCTTVGDDGTQLVVGNVRNFFLDIHPGSGDLDESSDTFSLPSCCGGISVAGGGTSSWSGEVSGEAPDVVGTLSFEAVVAQVVYLMLDQVPGLRGATDPKLVSAVHHVVISSPTIRESEQAFERGDTTAGLSEIANILSDRGFVLDVTRAIAEHLGEHPSLLLRLGAKLPLELITEVFKLLDLVEVATTLRDIQRAFIDAEGEPAGLVQFRRIQTAALPTPTPTPTPAATPTPTASPTATPTPTPNVGLELASVSAGDKHSCGVRTDDTVLCWGLDNHGQATAPDGLFRSVSAGLVHSCGVRLDSSVACWGSDEDGRASPPGGSFMSVSAGYEHTCGIRTDGSVVCWGKRDAFKRTEAPDGSFTSISAGRYYTCGVMEDKSVACWGEGMRRAPIPTGSFTQIDSGAGRACALSDDGSAMCWDHEGFWEPEPTGRFSSISATFHRICAIRKADGTVTCWERDPPANPLFDHSGSFSSISVGLHHVCGVTTDGDAKCWGRNESGQAEVPGLPFTSLSLGGTHACGVRADESIACWGRSFSGATLIPSGSFKAVSAGQQHNCAIRTTGELVCWGHDGTSRGSPLPTPEGVFLAVSTHDDHNCAIRADRSLHCWAENDYSGETDAPSGSFDSVRSDHRYNCALRTDGTVLCWGRHADGHAAPPDGTFTYIDIGCGVRPSGEIECWGGARDGSRPAGSAGPFTKVSVGQESVCGLRGDGSVECWNYQQEDVEGVPLGPFVAIESRDLRTCAIRSDGSVECWED